MKNALGNIMQQAQKMQEDLKKAQEELALMQVQGESGGGLVTIVMTGKREARKVTIDDSLLGEDKDMLEDLVAADLNLPQAGQPLAGQRGHFHEVHAGAGGIDRAVGRAD